MFYAAATPGWVANGNYTGVCVCLGGGVQNRAFLRAIHRFVHPTRDAHFFQSLAGWIILDKNDPTKIVQRSEEHIMVPLLPYEQV